MTILDSIRDELKAVVKYGAERVAIAGSSSTLTATTSGIWIPATQFVWCNQHGGESVELISSSANDTATGTGLQVASVVLRYASGQMERVEIETNGTAAVSIPGDVIDVVSLSGVRWGSGGCAAGHVSARTVLGSNNLQQIRSGQRGASAGRFQVPDGKIGIFRWWASGVQGANTAEFFFCHDWSKRDRRHLTTPVPVEKIDSSTSGWVVADIQPFYALPARTRVEFTGKKLGASTASGSVKSECILLNEDNELGRQLYALTI